MHVGRRLPRFVWPAAAALVIVAAAAVLVWRFAPGPRSSAPAGPPLVAVADFTNETGDPDLDGLSGLVGTALQESPGLRVLTQSRMHDLQRQLGKGGGGADRIDESMGRELGKRAGLRGLLLGAVRRMGELVVVELRAVDPERDEYLFSIRDQAQGKSEVLALVDRLAARARRQLVGERGPSTDAAPVAQLVRKLEGRGIPTLVDGAHAPGMLELDLEALRPAYYTGNLHKWVCAPKGAAFLWVREDKQAGLQPPVVSHGNNTPRPGFSAFQDRFDWAGTFDPAAWFCAGEAIRWMEKYAATGLKYDVARDDDLKSLAADPAFASAAEEMKVRTKAVQRAEVVCAFPLPDLMPEDLTFDRTSGTFVVSSIQHHTLYRVTLPKAGETECALQEVALEDQVRRWPVLAVMTAGFFGLGARLWRFATGEREHAA